MRFCLIACAASVGFLLGGCPPAPDAGPVTAVLAISSTSGAAPLSVAVSAIDSTSENEGALRYRWDFGDETTSTDAAVTHTYPNPGRYAITLRVTDASGATDEATATVRVQGESATAVIDADVLSGLAPLRVQFDGRMSSAADDEILDYYWNFGDGDESRLPAPLHIFTRDGAFTVELRVVSAGGVEARTTTTITVGQRNASLQFNGSQFASLPVGASQSLDALTFEIWFNSDSDGGTLAVLGEGAMTLTLAPGSNAIGIQVNAESRTATASGLAGTWRHLAVSYDSVLGAAVYLDGAPLGTFPGSGGVDLSRITIGNGYRGKAAEVRLWGVVRSATEIAATRLERLSGTESDLIANFPIDEGSGQSLGNSASNTDGTLGSTSSAENGDPAWSTDGPPL